MALRPVSELGLTDPTDIEQPVEGNSAAVPKPRGRGKNRAPMGEVFAARGLRGVAVPRDPTAAGDDPHTAAAPIAAEPAGPSEAAGAALGAVVDAPAPASEPAELAPAVNHTAQQDLASPPKGAARRARPGKRVTAVAERRLGDDPATFMQVQVPRDLHWRLNQTSHRLAASHPRLRHQKTIIGALLYAHVAPEDAERLADLAATFDAYAATELAAGDAPAKVGGHLPTTLRHDLEGAVLRLQRSRRPASAKSVVASLIWRYVDPEDSEALVPELERFSAAMQVAPLPLSVD